MGRQREKLSSRTVFIWLMAAAGVCLLLPGGLTEKVGSLFSTLVSPLTGRSRAMTLSATERVSEPGHKPITMQEYRQLQDQLRQSQRQLVNLVQENRKFRDIFAQWSGLRQRFGLAQVRLLYAEVVSDDSTGWRQIKVLNRGTKQQIAAGQIVLGGAKGYVRDEQGAAEVDVYQMCVVGRILRAGWHSSRMQLISDLEFRLPVFIEPREGEREGIWRANGVLGVMKGQGLGQVEMKVEMVSVPEQPIRAGDAVMACSDLSYLPAEMLVGYVKSCKPQDHNPLMWEIRVEPAVDLNRLEAVTVVCVEGEE